MRLCLTSRNFPSPDAHDHSRAVWEAAVALAAAGHEVHLLTAPPTPPTPPAASTPSADLSALPPGITLHTTDPDAGPAAIPQAYPTPALRHAMAVYAALLRLHAEHAFGYIEFPLADGEGYFALRGKRTLGAFDGAVLGARLSTPAADRRRENLISRFDGEAAFADHMETASLREADLLVSPTDALLELVRDRREHDLAWPTPAAAVVPAPRSPHNSDGAWSSAPAAPTVLFVGPLEARRGVRALADAAEGLLERHADLRVLFRGPDTDTAPIGRPMRAYLEARCPAMGSGRVAVDHTPADRETLRGLMRTAAVVCFPGVMHEPEWALLDAVPLGVPIVAADSPALRALAGGRLHLVPPGDAAALEAAITRVLSAPDHTTDPAPAPPSAPEFADALLRAIDAARTRSDDAPAAPARSPDAPDVSVIVTVFNLGQYLPETLASLDAQTLASREIIIIDDGSTDSQTVALIDRLERDGRHVIRQPNRGSASARNAGLRAARGRWAVFIDADDLIDPAYLEKLAGVLRRNPRLTYASTLVRCFENDDPSITTAGWVPLGMAGFDRDLLLCMNVGGIGAGSLVDRETLLAVGGCDERMPSYEDWELWCKLAHRGCRGAIVPEFLFSYRTRQDSKYRRQGLARHVQLKSHILAHHAAGGLVSSRTMRLQFAEAAAADTALRTAQEQLAAAHDAVREAHEARDGLARRTAEAEAGVASAWQHAGALEEMLKRTAAELKAAHQQAQEQAAQLAAADARAVELERRTAESLAELGARLERETAERARLESRLDLATTQTLLTGDRLARALADLAAAEQALAALRQQVAAHDCAVHTRGVLAENIRYRMADRVNSVFRGSGVHSVAKALARRTIASGGDDHRGTRNGG